MNKWAWNQFGDISDTEQLVSYLDGRAHEHTYYFHYTSLKAIDGILGSNSFYISSLSSFNDKTEANMVEKPELCFSLCFSTGVNENLPLWYLYSDLSGRGGRIRLTKNGINRLLGHATYFLSEKDSKGHPVGIQISLEPGKTIDIAFADVLYCSEGGKGNLNLKYNTMTNYIVPSSEKDKLYTQLNGFIKSPIWYYEKETRLMIRLIGEAEKYIDKDKRYMIIMCFDDKMYRMMRITFGPEVVDIQNGIKDFPNLMTFILNTSNTDESAYKGQIEMNLCRNCEYKTNVT